MANKRKILYRWHKRLGLTLGLILFLLGLSGVAITYRDELLPLTYPELMQVTPETNRISLENQVIAAHEYLGSQEFTHLYTAESDDTASMVFYRPPGTILPHLLAIDPYTGKVRGGMPLIQNIFGVMLYLHANLLLGKVGSWIVGLMGLLLTFFFISGIILWWPKESLLTKLKHLTSSRTRGLHRALGIFLGVPLVFSALTGFILAFDLMEVSGPKKPTEQVLLQNCSFEEQLSALKILTPEQQNNIVSIHFCSPKNGLMKFSFGHDERSGHHGYVRLLINPKTQSIVQTFDTQKDPWSWSANALTIFPMHSGAYFGGAGRILIFICGFALMILYLTGIWPTLKKKLKK